MNDFTIVKMFCNDAENPIGTDSRPNFSWQMQSTLCGDTQQTYRVLLAQAQSDLESQSNLLWDSGEIFSDQNTDILVPEEIEFAPRTKYFWQIIAKNSAGTAATSPVAFFETGKLAEKWTAHWIAAVHTRNDATAQGAPLLRKTVPLTGEVKDARLYVCGVGFYEAYVEGEKVSDAIMEPAYTKYDTTLYYKTYDVKSMLQGEKATLAFVLGNSWYNYFEMDEWNTKYASWHGVPKCIAELHIAYADGTTQIVCTDSAWKSSPGPITYNCMRNGEHYDARLEVENWNRSACDDANWNAVVLARSPGGAMKTSEMPPIKVMQTLAPIDFWENENGNWIFDFGQNMAGNALLAAYGKRDSEIVLQYSEILTEDRQHIDNTKLRQFTKSGEFQTEHYIKKSDDTEIWCSKFCYHGYRYVEVEGLHGQPTANTLQAQVMHTAFDRTGRLTCSEESINTILKMCHWSAISNYFGIPTDSPHREKNAWTGDASVVSEQFLLNYTAATSLLKWMDDVCDSQRPNGSIPCVVPSTGWGYNSLNGPDWSKALTEIPWNLYKYTGKKSILKKYYPYIKKHFEFMESMSENHLICCGIGDWCAPFEGAAISVNMSAYKAPMQLTDTACYYYSADILAKIEKLLGYKQVSKEKAQAIKAAWRAQFIDKENLKIAGDCQTSYACALYNGLLEEAEQKTVLEHLVRSFTENDYHVDFGLLGLRYVFNALGEFDRADVMYHCLRCETYPSYLYWHKIGRTTLGECWNGTGSQNHCMMSDVSASMYKYFAGIRTDEEENAGFRKWILQPSQIDRLDSLSCEHQTAHGTAAVRWETKGETVHMEIEVPFGTQAQFIVPCYLTSENEIPKFLGNGKYSFKFHKNTNEKRTV